MNIRPKIFVNLIDDFLRMFKIVILCNCKHAILDIRHRLCRIIRQCIHRHRIGHYHIVCNIVKCISRFDQHIGADQAKNHGKRGHDTADRSFCI